MQQERHNITFCTIRLPNYHAYKCECQSEVIKTSLAQIGMSHTFLVLQISFSS